MSCCPAGDVEGYDAKEFALGLAFGGVLDQRILHNANQRVAVRCDGEPFHAFIGDAADGVAGDLDRTHGKQDGNKKTRWRGGVASRELKGAEADSGDAVEFVDVGAVFVGDVDASAVIGDSQAFGVEASVEGIAGVLSGVEIVGASRKEMGEEMIEWRGA